MFKILFLVAAAAIYWKIPARLWRGVLWIYYEYRIGKVYHYIEYKFHGNHYHTRRSGALNDLEGNGLLCEVKKRGGKITYHKEGTKEQITEIIEWRANELAEKQGRVIQHVHNKRK
ncbi:hypothetical protein GAP31_055 [Cronobacter phage vB_CsaM_GAP31]|uniref:Uncharacterized protein n=1 Tax=Cronobacter phage vB_CsaM_GAP31 TaxID=1141135 RepID=K4F553_9CAUD|nr:hypothetical protein GAP31_055 [Cronobacter phage vB_CsaM_GAP31]AFC21236.1 hypothetical protein GAP31_055 [Cronobacter phage vB_CsaM_GAP31]